MASLLRQSRRLLPCNVCASGIASQFHSGLASISRPFSTSRKLLDDSQTSPKSDDGEATEVLDPAKDTQLKELLSIPLRKPIIPGGIPQVLTIADQPLIKQLKEMDQIGGQLMVAGFLHRDEPKEETGNNTEDADAITTAGLDPEQLHEVGTLCIVKKFSFISDSSAQAQLSVQGHRRIRRCGLVTYSPFTLQCRQVLAEAYNAEDQDIKAMHQELVQTLKTIFTLAPLYIEQMRHMRTGDFQDIARFTDLVVSLVNPSVQDAQDFLSSTSVPKRMEIALSILKKEVEVVNIQKKIAAKIEENISKDQKQYFLREQLKYIQKELGILKDDRQALQSKFSERFDKVRGAANEEAVQAFDEEMNKLASLEPSSSEFNVSRNYLDWLSWMPYGVMDEEKYELPYAKEALDEQHYGLKDVKERILEFIAVGKLNNDVQGKIICMVGPPGVGKTSIGKSIAKALSRKFYRFSVGGLGDVAEIKGHRRTYVGAMPGKMVQCLKQVQSSNPMVLIDEIDKLGRGGLQGDPASALLELLDPEQNAGFRDHYLDVPVDLSKVLFVCTANTLDTIPRPLLDRMEVIELSGYTSHEKVFIARQYIEKAVRKDAAMPDNAAVFTDGGLDLLIQRYCRESGVRNLKKQVEKLYRKVAYEIVKSDRVTYVEEEIPEDEDAHPVDSKESDASSTSTVTAGAPGTEAASSTTSTSTSSAESTSALPKEKKARIRKVPVYHGDPVVIDENNLDKYLGKAPFDSDRFYDRTPAGVVMGLAWTTHGGSTLYVESNKVNAGGAAALTITGQLGEVMKESVTIAQTYARRFVTSVDSHNTFLDEGTVHLHVPAGATPKDGPSAGCTMVSALLSLAFDTPVIPDVAMTGEISLSGRMLPIGGVKEKTLAAKRSGVKVIIFPDGNKGDWEELDDELRAGLEVHFARHYLDMFPILFPELADKYSSALRVLSENVETSLGKQT